VTPAERDGEGEGPDAGADARESDSESAGAVVDAAHLLEVAVALPVRGTFTYRDPRGATTVPLGTQVVVPFGHRTVTGFVVGHPAGGAGGARAGAPSLDVEEIVPGLPAFDGEMIALCRWAADYYQAPLGEVLRAALPQGEKATAIRSVRLTEAGRRALARQPGLLPGEPAPADRLLAALAASAGGTLSLKALARIDGRAAAQVTRLAAQGLVEVGDEVQERKRPPAKSFARIVAGADRGALPARAVARRALVDKLVAAGDIVRTVQNCDRALIADVVVFDVYEGAGLDPAKKSVAVEVTLQPAERTLTDAEIEAVAGKIVAEVSRRHGATLRS
jgi:hypothetical protein